MPEIIHFEVKVSCKSNVDVVYDGTMDMTEKWRKAIRHRNKLWRLFMRDRTDANYDHYKIQRNICTSLRRKVIKVVQARKPKGVLEYVSTLSSWQNKAGK